MGAQSDSSLLARTVRAIATGLDALFTPQKKREARQLLDKAETILTGDPNDLTEEDIQEAYTLVSKAFYDKLDGQDQSREKYEKYGNDYTSAHSQAQKALHKAGEHWDFYETQKEIIEDGEPLSGFDPADAQVSMVKRTQKAIRKVRSFLDYF